MSSTSENIAPAQTSSQTQAQGEAQALGGRQQEMTETELAELQTGECTPVSSFCSDSLHPHRPHNATHAGTAPIPRTMDTSPSQLDPRFDPDDLRQGKAPPAARKGGVLGTVNQHRPHLRKNVKKVKKLVPKRSLVPGFKGSTKREGNEEMVEVEEDVEESPSPGEEEGYAVGEGGEGEGEKKHGLMGKIFHHKS